MFSFMQNFASTAEPDHVEVETRLEEPTSMDPSGLSLVEGESLASSTHGVSSFGFMNSDEGGSSFSFLQPTPPPVETAGFSFMTENAEAEAHDVNLRPQTSSSFSFLAADNNEISNVDLNDTAGLLSLHVPSSNVLLKPASEIRQQEMTDLKLNATSLVKTVKKKKKSTKVGFGRDDDEDGEEKDKQQPSHTSSHASSVEVDLQGVRLDLPPTPPPPLPSHPPAAVATRIASMESPEIMADQLKHDHVSTSASLATQNSVPADPHHHSQLSSSEHTATATDHTGLPEEATLKFGTHSAGASHTLGPDPEPASEPVWEKPVVAIVPVSGPAAATPATVPVAAPAGAPSPEHVTSSITSSFRDTTFVSTPAASVPAVSVSVPPSSPSPLPETSVQRLERKSRETLLQLTRALNDLSKIHSSALAGQDRFRKEIKAEEQALEQAKTRAQTAEEEQQRLAAEEDFEKAEALNDVIQRSTAEAHSRLGTLADLRASVRMLEQTFAQERADCVSTFLSAANSLRTTREQLEISLTQQQTSSQRQWDLEDSRIKAELERISLEKGHFEREEQALFGDSERTEEAIRTQTGDLSSRKQELEASMDDLNEEIRILQQQLALKLSAQQQLARDLDLVDGKIGEVRKKYDRQLQRISDRQHTLQQSKAECLEEESAVLTEQAALEAQAADRLSKKQAATAWAASLVADIQVADVLLEKLKPSGAPDSSQVATISPLETATEDAVTAELKRKMESINFLLNKKRLLTSELHVQRDDLVSESRRLADLALVLDSEKKTHAASKRFKEAAAAAKELKEVQIAKETADASIEAIDVTAATALSEIAQLEEQEINATNALRDAHRQEDIGRFEALLTRAGEVRMMYKKVVRSKRRYDGGGGGGDGGGDGAAGPNQDIGEGVLRFLAAELEAIQKEALLLKAMHSLPQDVWLLTATEIEDEEEEEGTEIGNGSSAGGGMTGDVDTCLESSLGLGLDLEAKDVASGGRLEEQQQHAVDEGTVKTEGVEEEEQLTTVSPQEQLMSDEKETEDTEEEAATATEAGAEFKSVPDEEQLVAQRTARLREAKILMDDIAKLSAQLDEVTENEDYEQAAELFEDVTRGTEQLDKMLAELNCCKDEVEAFHLTL